MGHRDPISKCRFNATLFVSYGAENVFLPVPLDEDDQDGLGVLFADLPASNVKGRLLQYYLEVNDPQVGLNIRYPSAGAIDLFVVEEFVQIELPT